MTASQQVNVKVDTEALQERLGGNVHRESIEATVDAAWAEHREKLIDKIIEDFGEQAEKQAKKDAKDAHKRAEDELEAAQAGGDEEQARAWNQPGRADDKKDPAAA